MVKGWSDEVRGVCTLLMDFRGGETGVGNGRVGENT